MKKIIVESHVPFVAPEAFQGVAQMEVLDPEDITSQTVKDAEALIVRTRTRCNAQLLEGSQVKFVATATIGTDHIDKEYCCRKGIEVVSAPGCNAPAVEQYVWASILKLRPQWRRLTLGVVGCGHVGSRVVDRALEFGMNVIVNDPPRGEGWQPGNSFEPGNRPFVSLEELCAKADIITFHTPHTHQGEYPTHHLADHTLLHSWVKRHPLIINAARGPIVDTPELVSALRQGTVSDVAIDCWEGEPNLDSELLALAAIATPHIAGYSLQGKVRATEATVNAALRFFGSDRQYIVENLLLTHHNLQSAKISNRRPLEPQWPVTADAIARAYDPMYDTAALKANPASFEKLRDTYALRCETGFSES